MGETERKPLKVDCYWNLHLACWSVRHRGRVIRSVESLLLRDVSFVVQPAGRERVRREGRKNVHAFARGTLQTCNLPACFHMGGLGVGYNPYEHEHFVSLASGVGVQGAQYVWLRSVYDIATLRAKPRVVASGVRFLWPVDKES